MTAVAAADPARRRARGAGLVLIGVTAAWGITFPAIHEAVAATDPLVFVALRMTLAFAGMLLLFRRKLLTGWRGRIGQGVILATAFYLSYALQAAGLRYTTASRSAFITGMNVVIVPLFYMPIRRRAPGLVPLIGVVLSFAGLYLLTRPGISGGINPGDVLTLGCAVSYAFYVIFLESFTAKQSAEPLIGLQAAIVAVMSVVILPLVPQAAFAPHAAGSAPPAAAASVAAIAARPAGVWSSGLWIGLLVTVPVAMFTFVAITRFQPRISATRAAVIYSAEPVFALAFAALWLGERLDAAGLAGAGLMLAGALVAVWS